MNYKRDVWEAVEEFRMQHPKELCSLPVDVLTVIELNLRLDVIPFADLLEKYSVDAAVISDFSGIYVDERSYKFLAGEPAWRFNRLRFSLAHELGHIVLHREMTGGLKFANIQEFFNWTRRYEVSQRFRKRLRIAEWCRNFNFFQTTVPRGDGLALLTQGQTPPSGRPS